MPFRIGNPFCAFAAAHFSTQGKMEVYLLIQADGKIVYFINSVRQGF
jgi:hypothetical protein